ncbi:MAG: hypothetical protein OSJ55_01355 [Bacteroidales bacterium]|nr:hypothetical protein [Bacteroidales bacterium]
MDRLFKTFVYAFLWSLSLVCAAKNDTVTVIQTLPKVECANKILDNEIRHYLAQQDSTDQVCYWNMQIQKENDTYVCLVFREPDHIPNRGIAYLQYGYDIIVIEGKLDKTLFNKIKGCDLAIKMAKNRTLISDPVAYLGVRLFKNRLAAKYSIYDPCR